MNATPRWDIFCQVVDNYGDVGVCWRLARQLAAEHGLAVRLWVDDLASLARIARAIAPALDAQRCAGVNVRRWKTAFGAQDVADGVADVVIEAFACHLPEPYVQAMAGRSRKPVWINLEYLSAENWVRGCHGLASPYPRLPLTKHFFFPGFFAGTGGLIRERGLLEVRDALQSDAALQAAFWAELGVPQRRPGELRATLFSYRNAAIPALLSAWAAGEQAVTCLAPEGPAAQGAAAWAGLAEARAGAVGRRGALELRVLPFVEQERYDRLLWACDVNFVRGEDSFVRAQWAGQPMVWQIYPQAEDAHWLKLDAFLDLYSAEMSPEAAGAAVALHRAWNRSADVGAAWTDFAARRAALAAHARWWASQLAQAKDLAAALVEFCGLRLK